MTDIISPLSRIFQASGPRAMLSDADRVALLGLPYVRRSYEPTAYFTREGEPSRRSCPLILSGFAFRQKITTDGSRQIISLHMPGDLVDLQMLFLARADHSLQALTRIEVAEIDRDALQVLVMTRPGIAVALWADTLVDASIYREWILNIGRRDARGRIAHLLCEFALRLEAAGIAAAQRYELPMTQEQIGDAVGLTSVHVNRTLKSLEADGLIVRDRRYIRFLDWDRIRATADFSATYLHSEQNAFLIPKRA